MQVLIEDGFTLIQPVVAEEQQKFCKIARPEYGTIFNLDSGEFEPITQCFEKDAVKFNNMFSGWLLRVRSEALSSLVVGDYVKLNDEASVGKVYKITEINGDHYKVKSEDGTRFCRSWRLHAYKKP